MSTYQDVVRANGALGAWALTEAAGATFAPYLGSASLTGSGALSYRQAGPFAAAFGLGLAAGAALRLTFGAIVAPPVTIELWVKLSAAVPATLTVLTATGNLAANGAGFYVATNGHLHWIEGGVQDVDTGLLWPNTNWHLFDFVAEPGNLITAALDGAVIWRSGVATANAPAPNTLGYSSDGSGLGAGIAAVVSFPAFYALALTPQAIATNFLASTDPNAAILNTGGSAASLDALLNLIYAAVHKLY